MRGTSDVGPPVVRQGTILAVRSATARYKNSDIQDNYYKNKEWPSGLCAFHNHLGSMAFVKKMDFNRKFGDN